MFPYVENFFLEDLNNKENEDAMQDGNSKALDVGNKNHLEEIKEDTGEDRTDTLISAKNNTKKSTTKSRSSKQGETGTKSLRNSDVVDNRIDD